MMAVEGTAIYRTWVRRIESGVFTKAQCQQRAQVVRPISVGDTPRGKKTNLTPYEARMLAHLLTEHGGVRLTAEHEAQGLTWIRRYHAAEFPPWVTEKFDHFSFQGEGYNIGHTADWPHYIPVWRIHGTEHQALDYCASAWQSGRTGPRVIRSTSRLEVS